MSEATPEPLAVYDASDAESWPRQVPDLELFLQWARDQGIEPNNTYRIEIHLIDDCPFARVFQFGRDDSGARPCVVDHDHRSDFARCEPARPAPFDVPISSMPPAGPFARGRR